MDENPSKSPRSVDDCQRADIPQCGEGSEPTRWHPLTWAFVGFGIGTVLASPFVLSAVDTDQLRGGMLFGGIPGALVGFACGRPKPSPLDGP